MVLTRMGALHEQLRDCGQRLRRRGVRKRRVDGELLFLAGLFGRSRIQRAGRENVEARRTYIEEHALEVRNLDV